MATLIRGDGRTVNAFQDSVLGDFAFSGKNGIIKDVGQACGLDTTTLNSVKVKSGMVVIQGRQITLDGTDTITLPVATGSTVYWTTLYLELDLSAIADDELTGKVTLKKLEYTSSYPAVPTSDNLKVQTAGKAYLGLYRFKNTANGVTSVEAIASIIDSSVRRVQEKTLCETKHYFSEVGDSFNFELSDSILNYDNIEVYGTNDVNGHGEVLLATLKPDTNLGTVYVSVPMPTSSESGDWLYPYYFGMIFTNNTTLRIKGVSFISVEGIGIQIKRIVGTRREEI